MDTLIDSPLCRRLEKVALRDAAILALSDYTAASLRRLEPGVRQTTMPMPIDFAHLPSAGERPGVPESGRLRRALRRPAQEHAAALRCACDLPRPRLAVTCDLVGDDPPPELVEYLRARGIADAVRFLGFRARGRSGLLQQPRRAGHSVAPGRPGHRRPRGDGVRLPGRGDPLRRHRGLREGRHQRLSGRVLGRRDGGCDHTHPDRCPAAAVACEPERCETVRRDYSEAGVERVFWRSVRWRFRPGRHLQ